jgi:hypothetical protein
VYRDTRHAGIYTVLASALSQRYAAALLDEGESDLTPGRGVSADSATDALQETYQSRRELWMPLAALALLALVAEAMLYYRRLRASASATALALRGVVLALVGLALFRMPMRLSSDALHVAFLLDTSDSIAVDKRLAALQAAGQALRHRKPQDSAGLIAFGTGGESGTGEHAPRAAPEAARRPGHGHRRRDPPWPGGVASRGDRAACAAHGRQ